MKIRVLKDKKLTTAKMIWQKFQNAELLKYSPERRCLFQITIGQSDYFVKVYPKKFLRRNRGKNIHFIGQKLWNLAQTEKLNFRVPIPFLWEEETRTLWQKRLEGIPVIEFMEKEKSKKIVFQIGQSIAQIADLEIVPPRFFDRTEQLKDSSEFAEKLTEKFPRLRLKSECLLNLLANSHQFSGEQNLVPTHGDMHIDQWLFDPNGLGLLDFEDFCYAEAERDLAFFAVQIEAEYGSEFCLSTLEKELFAGFKSSGKRINKKLFKVYKAHKWLAKAARKSDENEAVKILDKAFVCLEKI